MMSKLVVPPAQACSLTAQPFHRLVQTHVEPASAESPALLTPATTLVNFLFTFLHLQLQLLPMVAIPQHACNRKPDTDPTLFKNDSNNVSALQIARQQKKLMEGQARLQRQQLDEAAKKLQSESESREKVEQECQKLEGLVRAFRHEKEILDDKLTTVSSDKEKVQQERDKLSEEVETLRKEKKDELATADTKRQGLESKLTTALSDATQQRRDIETLKSSITTMEKKLPGSREENCLPFQYHNATVMIINLKSHMPMDSGKGKLGSSNSESAPGDD